MTRFFKWHWCKCEYQHYQSQSSSTVQHLRTSHIAVQFASKIPVAELERYYGFLGEFIQQKICLLLGVYAFFRTKVIFFFFFIEYIRMKPIWDWDLQALFRFLSSKWQPENSLKVPHLVPLNSPSSSGFCFACSAVPWKTLKQPWSCGWNSGLLPLAKTLFTRPQIFFLLLIQWLLYSY